MQAVVSRHTCSTIETVMRTRSRLRAQFAVFVLQPGQTSLGKPLSRGRRHNAGSFLAQPVGDSGKFRRQNGLAAEHSFDCGKRAAVVSPGFSERENDRVHLIIKMFHVHCAGQNRNIF